MLLLYVLYLEKRSIFSHRCYFLHVLLLHYYNFVIIIIIIFFSTDLWQPADLRTACLNSLSLQDSLTSLSSVLSSNYKIELWILKHVTSQRWWYCCSHWVRKQKQIISFPPIFCNKYMFVMEEYSTRKFVLINHNNQ